MSRPSPSPGGDVSRNEPMALGSRTFLLDLQTVNWFYCKIDSLWSLACGLCKETRFVTRDRF